MADARRRVEPSVVVDQEPGQVIQRLYDVLGTRVVELVGREAAGADGQ